MMPAEAQVAATNVHVAAEQRLPVEDELAVGCDVREYDVDIERLGHALGHGVGFFRRRRARALRQQFQILRLQSQK